MVGQTRVELQPYVAAARPPLPPVIRRDSTAFLARATPQPGTMASIGFSEAFFYKPRPHTVEVVYLGSQCSKDRQALLV